MSHCGGFVNPTGFYGRSLMEENAEAERLRHHALAKDLEEAPWRLKMAADPSPCCITDIE